MVLQQVKKSFQNDGNFSLIDLKDLKSGGRLLRLESFRASQPDKRTKMTTAAGTFPWILCGDDHLKSGSDQVFRHIFSAQEKKIKEMSVHLELREKFQEDGSWEVKIRDLYHGSYSYGSVLVCNATPERGSLCGKYELKYELYNPNLERTFMFTSPLERLVSSVDNNLPDLSESNGRQGVLQAQAIAYVDLSTPAQQIDDIFAPLQVVLQEKRYAYFVQNALLFMQFSTFQGRCEHSGDLLVGDFIPETAQHLRFFQSAACDILFRKLFWLMDQGAPKAGQSMWKEEEPMRQPANVGIQHYLILAHILQVEHFQLILDKLYSDYSEIPMKVERGSKIENGREAKKSAYRANQTLAKIAMLFYEPQVKIYPC